MMVVLGVTTGGVHTLTPVLELATIFVGGMAFQWAVTRP
jgi:hypothetical protein